MKRILFIPIILFTFTFTAKAQINLEHTYQKESINLYAIGDNEFKYVTNIKNRKFTIYNSDHSLYKTVQLPSSIDTIVGFYNFFKNVFTNDNKIGFIIYSFNKKTADIFDEDGQLLKHFSSVSIPTLSKVGDDAKLIVPYHETVNNVIQYTKTEVYSLPGKFPTGLKPEKPAHFNTEIYPNPVTQGIINIKYQLPQNANNAQLKIFDANGKAIQTYALGKAFDNIVLQSQNFNPGVYNYLIIADGKQVSTSRFVVY